MRRRLWRDPVPPRKLRPDYPPWLQEIALRCLEIEPVWRHPTASQLVFELAHPDQVKLTARSERLKRDPLSTVLRRRAVRDRKSTRLNSSHANISYAVFCLKKKRNTLRSRETRRHTI